MKQRDKLFLVILTTFFYTSVHATRITTGNIADTTTSGTPLTTNISLTPSASIRFDVGGASFVTSGAQLSISISVDALVPTVTSGTAPNQMFRDETVGAAYFGYYLTTGVKSSSQTSPNMNIKIRRGSSETSGRSYYVLGNGTTTPSSQGDLIAAPASFTTFATAGPNGVHCGPSHATNGLSGSAINCLGGSTVANMDITHFAKVLDTDSISGSISSQLEFIAVNE